LTRSRALRAALLLASVAAVWLVAAALLWDTSVPGDLLLPDVDPARLLVDEDLERAERFERVSRLIAVLGEVALLVVLGLYAWRGHVLVRESAAGRIGTGMMLGMLGLALVWLSQLPFALVAHWWSSRYGLVERDFLLVLVEDWLALAGAFLFICLALLIVMAFAIALGRTWWVAAAPAFVGLGIVFAFVFPYLVPVERLDDPQLERQAERFAREQGIQPIPVRVEEVSDFTSVPNAWAGGLGPSRRVVVWDTLLDGRFSDGQIAVVLAHEVGHHAREHLWKSVGWYALFAFPGAFLIAVATRRRGGMAEPAAVPVSLLVLVVLQTLALPLDNAFSRRLEAEADWVALEATRAPAAAEELFVGFTEEALADPTPPAWSYALLETHPSTEERVAMARAWAARNRR
jgi:STE24 endopeptidase